MFSKESVSIEDLRPETYVLRLGHRPERDKRISTHVALVARAFGCRGLYLVGAKDEGLRRSIEKVLDLWGGKSYFIYQEIDDYRRFIRDWKIQSSSCIVHLTMYGLPINQVIEEIRSKCSRILVIVGAEKVPRDVYEYADYNVSIGLQPHSEVSSLAIFLDRLYSGRELSLVFSDAKLRIIPSAKGKRVAKVSEGSDH